MHSDQSDYCHFPCFKNSETLFVVVRRQQDKNGKKAKEETEGKSETLVSESLV